MYVLLLHLRYIVFKIQKLNITNIDGFGFYVL